MRHREPTLIQAKAQASGFPGGSPARAGTLAGPEPDLPALALQTLELGQALIEKALLIQGLPQRLQLSDEQSQSASAAVKRLQELLALADKAIKNGDADAAKLLFMGLNAYSLTAVRMMRLLETQAGGEEAADWQALRERLLQDKLEWFAAQEADRCKDA